MLFGMRLLAMLVALWFAWPAVVVAQTGDGRVSMPTIATSTLENGATPYDQAVFLSDPDKRLTIEEALASARWHPFTVQDRNQGITSADFWIGFRIENDTPAARTVAVSHDIAHLSRFSIFVIEPNGSPERRDVPPLQPIAERDYDFAGPAAAVTVPAGGSRDIVIAFGNEFAIPIYTAIRVWHDTTFVRYATRTSTLYTALAASILTTAGFWLIYGLAMWQGRLFYYSVYLMLVAYTFTNFFGIGYQLVYAGERWLQMLGYHWSMFLMVAAAFAFARRHLELPRLHPRHNLAMKFAILANIAGAAFALLVRQPAIEAPLTFAALTGGPLYIAWLSWRAWRYDGIAYTKWMVLGWGLITLMTLLGVFSSLLDVPWLAFSQIDFVRMAFMATVVESFILSISLAQWLRGLDVRRVAAEIAAAHDPLTGLLNRRGFNEAARSIKQPSGWPDDLWLAAIDIDGFRHINDRYGHAACDVVLERLSRLLTERRKPGDLAARYGGEDFLLLFATSTRPKAVAAVERLRKRFTGSPTVYRDNAIHHTLSAGLVRVADHPDIEPAMLVLLADEALDAAKRAGRNRVHLALAARD